MSGHARADRSGRRRVGGAALALTLLSTMSACGGGDDLESYCAEVQAQQKPLTEAAAAGATGLLEALPSFEALRDAAPEDIVSAWVVVVQRVTVLAEALDAAGVDAASYDPDNPPSEVSPDTRAAIAAAASGLVTEAMIDALNSVQQQARDVCKIPLSL